MKDKNVKTVAIILGVILLMYILYRIYQYNKPPKLAALSGNPFENATGNYTDSPTDYNAVLKKNMTGNAIKMLQTEINNKLQQKGSALSKLTIDGVYGSGTDERIQQISNGMISSSKGNVTINNVKNL